MAEQYLDEPRIVEILREAMREGPKSINELAAIAAHAGADNALQWETEQGKDKPCGGCGYVVLDPPGHYCTRYNLAEDCPGYCEWRGHQGGKREMAQWVTARCRERIITIEQTPEGSNNYAAALAEVQDWLSEDARGIAEQSGKPAGGWQGTTGEWREEIISLLKTYRGIETICPRCSGWGVRAYGNTSTWRHGIGGQQITSGLCDGCWGSGDAERKWVSPIEIEAKIKAQYGAGLADGKQQRGESYCGLPARPLYSSPGSIGRPNADTR